MRPSIYSGLVPDVREAPRFTGARMANAQIFGRLDFADFQGADLTGVKFLGALGSRDENLSLGQGSYRAANFSQAKLAGVDFGGGNLYYARFAGADLRGANLKDTNLTRADFTGADLTGADVSGADLDEATVSGAKGLDKLKGLDQARNSDRLIR
jgi:uncharacterized protein YjbI with pentapeptide repeats